MAETQRERLRLQRKREREREYRMEQKAGLLKKPRVGEDDRDVSEKIALGVHTWADGGGRGWTPGSTTGARDW